MNGEQSVHTDETKKDYETIKQAYTKLIGRENKLLDEQMKRGENERVRALREAEKYSKKLVQQYTQSQYTEVRGNGVTNNNGGGGSSNTNSSSSRNSDEQTKEGESRRTVLA